MAQGNVNWGSVPPPSFSGYTNATVASSFDTGALTGGTTSGKTATTAGGFYYEVLYNTSATEASVPTTLTALEAWSDAGLSAVNSTSTAGAILTTGQGTADAVAGLNTTGSITLMVVGWSANLGTSLSSVESKLAVDSGWTGNAFFGTSSLGYLALNTGNPGSTIIGVGTGQIDSPVTELYEVPVASPEPTTIALGVVGGLSLLALRRKKA